MRANRRAIFKNDLARFLLARLFGWLFRNLLCRIGCHKWQPGVAPMSAGLMPDEAKRRGFVEEFSRWCWFCDKAERKAGRRLSRVTRL